MFKLPDLPYGYNALEPALSAATMHLHHDKHHAKYVDTLNTLLKESGARPASLEDVVRQAPSGKLFNNAGQAWNHGFFWESMTPDAAPPADALAKAIDRDFGGLDGLKAAFTKAGAEHFGSGWVWLVATGDKLSVSTTHDGATVITDDKATPILVCDLWEHAYYLDHKNDRAAFLDQWWTKLANWRFAAAQYDAATGAGHAYRFPEPVAQAA